MQRTERPVQTRFRCAFTYRLKLARYTKSLTHYTKGTPSGLRPPTVCRQPVSGSISLPLSGCFSPFPHGTCSLSVMHEYLGLEGGPPNFKQDFTCPALLKDLGCSTCTGLSPATADLSMSFHFIPQGHWPGPRSLATTCGVSVDVLSCGYLDVSVPRVRFLHPMYSGVDTLLLILGNLNWQSQFRFPKYLRWVSPFGNPWIKAYSQLPTAYRSVSRPSSPVHAKASTNCPSFT
jgi:hypothetical protein